MIIKLIFVYNCLQPNVSRTLTLFIFLSIFYPTTSGADPGGDGDDCSPSPQKCLEATAPPNTFGVFLPPTILHYNLLAAVTLHLI